MGCDASDRLMRTADILLEIRETVTVKRVREALTDFRQWNHLVKKPLLVTDYAYPAVDTQALLTKLGLSTHLTKHALELFGRPTPRANTWCRTRGIAPGRTVDLFELFAALTLTARGTLKETLTLLFSLFEVSGSGMLGEHGLGALISSCASVMRRLGLALPITIDDAAYVAAGVVFEQSWRSRAATLNGGDIGMGDEHESGGHVEDGLNLQMFLRWALSSEFPTRALELLTLPHRFSRVLGHAAVTIALLRERYTTIKGNNRSMNVMNGGMIDTVRSSTRPPTLTDLNERASPNLDVDRLMMSLQECSPSASAISFAFPPMLSCIGPHGAGIVLEIANRTGGASSSSLCFASAIVEERQGSRFSLVDVQSVVLVAQNPAVLRIWGLRPGTDHRFRLAWRTPDEADLEGRGCRDYGENDVRTCTSIRFKTLPADARVASQPTVAFEELTEPAQQKRHIEVLSSCNGEDANADPFDAFCGPETTRTESWAEGGCDTTGEGGLAVLIAHSQGTSLEVEAGVNQHHDGDEPWWISEDVASVRFGGRSDGNHPRGLAWPPTGSCSRKESLSSTLSPPLASVTVAPFCGEGVAEAVIRQAQPWGVAGGADPRAVDIVLHLSPGWSAPETIRRCFEILEGCLTTRKGSSAKEDSKQRVSREVIAAVRALLWKTSRQHERRAICGGQRKSTHIIVGDIDPFLGLEKEEVVARDEDHVEIVRSAVESVCKTYVWNRGMCGGGSQLASQDGGSMPICRGLFIVRPGKVVAVASTVRSANEQDSGRKLTEGLGSVPGEVYESTESSTPSTRQAGDESRFGEHDDRCSERAGGEAPGSIGASNGEVPDTSANFDESRVARKPDQTRTTSTDADNDAVSEKMETTANGNSDAENTLSDHSNGNDPGKDQVEDTTRGSNSELSSVSPTDHLSRGNSSMSGLDIGENSSLGKLLLDMTRTANGLLASPAEEPGPATMTIPDMVNITAVVLLDSPLFSDARPPTTAVKKILSKYSAARSTPHLKSDPAVFIQDDADRDSNNKSEHSSPVESTPSNQQGKDVDNEEKRQIEDVNDDGDENRQNVRRSVDVPRINGLDALANVHAEGHLAGLGDPAVALAALTLWIRDGPAAGCRGRREVLLVCGSGGTSGRDSPADLMITTDANSRIDSTDPEANRRIAAVGSRNKNGSLTNQDEGKKPMTQATTETPANPERKENAITPDKDGRITERISDTTSQSDESSQSTGTNEGDTASECSIIRQITLGKGVCSTFSTTPFSLLTRQTLPADERQIPQTTATVREPVEIPSLADLSFVQNKINRTSTAPVGKSVYLGPCQHSELLLRIGPSSGSDGRSPVVAVLPNLATPRPVPASPRTSPHKFNHMRHSQRDIVNGEQTAQDSKIARRREWDPPVVTVGPVIGRVGPTTAVVLVEVDAVSQAAIAAVGVVLLDTLTRRTAEMVGGVRTGDNDRGPLLFEFEELTPGRRYVVRLVGVQPKDHAARQGGFSTPLEGDGLLAMWALSPLACPREAIGEMLADLQTTRPTARIALNVGPMVDASKAARALYPFVMAAQEKHAAPVEDRTSKSGGSYLGRVAYHAFRELYLDAWSEPHTRKLLANCSTVGFSGAGALLLPLLMSLPAGWLPAPSAPSPTSFVQPLRRNRRNCKRRRTENRDVKKETDRTWLAKALGDVANAAMEVSQEYEQALWGIGSTGGYHYCASQNDDPGFHHHAGGGQAGTGGRGPLPRFQRWGPVGVLYVSSFSAQVELALGAREYGGGGILLDSVWDWLENFFRAPETCLQEGPGLSTLIVVTDSPLLWRSTSAARSAEVRGPQQRTENTKSAGSRGTDGSTGSSTEHTQGARLIRQERADMSPMHGREAWCREHTARVPAWDMHPRDSARLLRLLFEWAATGCGSVDHDCGDASEKQGRAFTMVCPAVGIRVNLETFVKDSASGRLAVQWCLASKEGGTEAEIPMSGSIGDRFSFTHYPQGGKSNGPGVSLVRPIPDPSAPTVTFLGMASKECGGAGLAFGTLGPMIGNVGTSTARVLVEVSVPMELFLTVQKVGADKRVESGAQSGTDSKRLRKVAKTAHRPVAFDVTGLHPDTRYLLAFSPLANGESFRGSLRTRALRPFSFRVAALAGSQNPFGFVSTVDKNPATVGTDENDGYILKRSRNNTLTARWPYCSLDCHNASSTEEALATRKVGVGSGGEGWREGLKRRYLAGGRRGGWRNPRAIAAAIDAATNGQWLKKMEIESLMDEGNDARAACATICGRSGWQELSQEVDFPGQGLDLVIHLGKEINGSSCFSTKDIEDISRNAFQRTGSPPNTLVEAGTRSQRPFLIHPPQLPNDDDPLGPQDESGIIAMQGYFTKVHDEAERRRKLGGDDDNDSSRKSDVGQAKPGDTRRRSVAEPDLDIVVPQEAWDATLTGGSNGTGDGSITVGTRGRLDRSETDHGHGTMRAKIAPEVWSDNEMWALATDEVAERVRDVYRVAWGLPWSQSVMSATPNVCAAFTPKDLDDGCLRLSTASTLPSGGATAEDVVVDSRRNPDGMGGTPNPEGARDHPASVGRLREEGLRAFSDYQKALSGMGPGDESAVSDKLEGSDKRGSDKREKDRGSYTEYGGIGVLVLDVWSNQPWRLDQDGMALAKDDEDGPGFHPRALLSKRQEKLMKKALSSASTNALLVCSGTPMVAEPITHPKAPPLSAEAQRERDKALRAAKKELRKLGKAGKTEIRRMEEEEKSPKLALLSPAEVGRMGPFYDESRPCFQWSYHSPYLQEVLEKLFDWAAQGMHAEKGLPARRREVVLLCGGTGSGVRTMLHDRRTGLSFTQICVGNISDATVPCPWSQSPGTLGDRIDYTHYPASIPSSESDVRDDVNDSKSKFGKLTGEGGLEGTGGIRRIAPGGVSLGTTVGQILRRDEHPDLSGDEEGNAELAGDEIKEQHVRRKSLSLENDLNVLESRSTEGTGIPDYGRRQNAKDGTRSIQRHFPLFDSRPSYAVVNILSEPLESCVEARLVLPPGGPNDKAMQASNGPTNGLFPAVSDFSTVSVDSAAAKNRIFSSDNRKKEARTDAVSAATKMVEAAANRGPLKLFSPGDNAFSSPAGINAILGPVVGRVEVLKQFRGIRESCRVGVLLEVDADGSVTCVVRDVVTSETFREERSMKRRRPRAFWMQGLRAARRYSIEFEGISNREDRKGVLTTPDSSQPDLAIAALCHDRPGELPSGGSEQNLWCSLADRLSSPWQGLEVIIHIGGQVDMSNAFEDARAYLMTNEVDIREGKFSAEEEALAVEGLKERFRTEYRKVWNQPSTRKVLSSCQHVMMWGQSECRMGYGRSGHAAVSSWAGKRLLRIAKEVFREYQRQLWDPRWGAKFRVGDHEAFFTTFRWGTVGVLSLDATELSDHKPDLSGKNFQRYGGGNSQGTGARGEEEDEDSMLGRSQWEMLDHVLNDKEDLITLLVVSEMPIVWHDTEAVLAKTKVTLLAGAGANEGCVAAETRLEFKIPPPIPSLSESGENQATFPPDSDQGVEADEVAGEDGQSREMKPRLVEISQVTCGPITAQPLGTTKSDNKPITKGKLAVPLTEAKKMEKTLNSRKQKANDNKGGTQERDGDKGNARDWTTVPKSDDGEPPVDFVHITNSGRNYVVLQVIADHDEEGPIGVIDSAHATSLTVEKAHPTHELSRPPPWWISRCIGNRTILLDDDVYLKGREMKGAMDARFWLETKEAFKEATRRYYDEFYIADAARPVELRTIRVDKTAVLRRHVEDAIKAVYEELPAEIKQEMGYVPDQIVLDFLLLKAFPETTASAVDTTEKWETLCRQVFLDTAYLRVAALWAEEDENDLLSAAARAEEAVRKAEAQEAHRRELEVKEAERDAAEMAGLLTSDPEAHMRRVVQKRADEADRRARKVSADAKKAAAEREKAEALEKRKAEDAERLKREAKEREADEQKELNLLADTDPVEYDRRIKEWNKRKLEARERGEDEIGATGGGGSGGDQAGDLERRKSLARERRAARRAAMHERPSVGVTKAGKS